MFDYKKIFFPQHDDFWPYVVPVILIFVLWFLCINEILISNGILAPETDKKTAEKSIEAYKQDLLKFPGKPIITLARQENGNVEDSLTVRVLDGRGTKLFPIIKFFSIVAISFVFSAWVTSVALFQISPSQSQSAVNKLSYVVMIGCFIGFLYHYGFDLIIKYILKIS